MDQKADLHIHSHFSDSDYSVEDIFQKAKEKELTAIAITDHDTTGGIEPALASSAQFGVEFLPGIEISAQYRDFEVHILGYGIDHRNSVLSAALSDIKTVRLNRLVAMAKKMNEIGQEVDIDQLTGEIEGKIATRFHLALYMVKRDIVSSIWEAFHKYLAPGKPAYVARLKFSAKEAIDLILKSGGVPVLAHPHMLAQERWIEEFVSYGIRGIEAVYHGFSKKQKKHYRQLAEKYNLLTTGGSDAHGSLKKYNEIGSVTVPYSWVERIKDEQRKRISSRSN